MSACPACGLTLTGCTCGWRTTDDFEVVAEGDAIVLEPRIDPVSGNLVVCGPSGLEATLAERYTNPPRFRIYRSTSKSYSASEQVQFDGEVYDSHGMHSTASSTVNPYVIIPLDGLWKVGFCVKWAGSGSGYRQAFLYANRFGSNLNRFGWQKDNGRATGNWMNREVEGVLKAGDTLTLELGSSISVSAQADGVAATAMWGRWLGDAA